MRSNSGNGIAIILIAIAFAALGFVGGKFIGGNKIDSKDLYNQFSKVRYHKNLILSKRTVDKLIFVEREDRYASKLKLLINIPVTFTAEFNLTSLDFTVDKDNIINVILPEPIIHGPDYNLEEAENIDIYQSLGLGYSNAAYNEVFSQFHKEITEQIANMKNHEAIAELKEEATTNLSSFLQSYAESIGCGISFTSPE